MVLEWCWNVQGFPPFWIKGRAQYYSFYGIIPIFGALGPFFFFGRGGFWVGMDSWWDVLVMGVTGVVRYSGWLRCLFYRARRGTVLMVYLVPTVKYRTVLHCARGEEWLVEGYCAFPWVNSLHIVRYKSLSTGAVLIPGKNYCTGTKLTDRDNDTKHTICPVMTISMYSTTLISTNKNKKK